MRFRTIAEVFAALVVIAVGVPVGLNAVQRDEPDRRLAQQEARAGLRAAGGGRVNRVSDHKATGFVRFVGTEPGRPIPTKQEVPVAAARAFLDTYGAAFGVHESNRDLVVSRAKTLSSGAGSVVRFQQEIADVPVIAGEFAVRLDAANNVITALGEVLPSRTIDQPSVDPAGAAKTARAAVAKSTSIDRRALSASEPTLWIYSPQLIGAPDGPDVLVWRTTVTAARPIAKVQVLVDALTGNVALYVDELRHARDRRVCNNNNNPNPPTLACPNPVRVEGGPATAIADVDQAYDYTGDTYDFYFSRHGRDSIDDVGMPIKSMVKYCDSFVGCPMLNAFWFADQLTFGEGFVADDVVAHELTHGVTEKESSLFYAYQSGAINESLSDVWGEFVDLVNAKGNDAASVRWLLGEDVNPAGVVFDGAVRDMQNPPAFNHPDRMRSELFYAGEDDNGGVHFNSGVNNKAAFLLTDGGTFNGQTVAPLGIDKVADIYYEAATAGLTSGSDYADLYDALQQACSTLTGTGGVTAADCAEVTKAVTATEMSLPPLAGGAAEAPLCDTGDMTSIFFDNIESGTTGWNSSPSGAWKRDDLYARSGDFSWLTVSNATSTAVALSMTSSKPIPPGSKAYLRFDHSHFFEHLGNSNFDGGVVEYSTNNGSTWADVRSLPAVNGYNGTIADDTDNPLDGQPGFVGHSHGYISTRIDLSSKSGSSIRFRFRYGTDEIVNDLGWAIDDIRIYTCAVPPQPILSINDATVSEGDSGTKAATFTVTKTGSTANVVTVNYATANGTGASPATAGSDYDATSGSLSFGPSETSKTISVTINGDTTIEPNETYTVGLSSPTSATIGDGSGLGTITNDDVARDITVTDVTVVEGDVATFTIEATHPEEGDVTFDVATADGTATSIDDYTEVPSTLVTIAGGEMSMEVDVDTTEDSVGEVNQTFDIELSDVSANGVLVDQDATATIVDDDARILSVADVTVTEGGVATFTVTGTNPDLGAVTVDVETVADSATAADYAAVPVTPMTIPAGTGASSSVSVPVQTTDDSLVEGAESFKLKLTNPSELALISDAEAEATILDNDVRREVSINTNRSATEGGDVTFTITATHPEAGPVTVDVDTAEGTADEDEDYEELDTSVTVSDSETSKIVKVETIEDDDEEDNETFFVDISNVVGNGDIDTDADRGKGTINDDDDDDDGDDDDEEPTPTPMVTPTPTGIPGAKLAYSPTTLVAGKSATVSGTGFPANTLIDLYIFSEPILLGSIRTTASGTFAFEVDIPLLAAGQHTLVALRASDDSPVASAAATLSQVGTTATQAPGTTPAPTARVFAAEETPVPAGALPDTGANVRAMVMFALIAIALGASSVGAERWVRRRRAG
ncbi:MAG: Calx-beta domain-containing protein [Actinomycetota bacterium]